MDNLEQPNEPSGSDPLPPRDRVWKIEVPKLGYSWFTSDHERVLFWQGRDDAIVTAYVEADREPRTVST